MANRVVRHLLGYNCYLYTGIGGQLKTLNVLEIWNDLHNYDSTKFWTKHKFNGQGLIRIPHFTLSISPVAHDACG